MTEANLQADGLVEEPAQRVVDLRGMEEEDSSPILTDVVPCPEATYRLSQYKLLFINTGNINR